MIQNAMSGSCARIRNLFGSVRKSHMKKTLVLLDEPGAPSMRPYIDPLAASTSSHDLVAGARVVTSGDLAQRELASAKASILVTNTPSYDLLSRVRADHPSCTIVLVTELPMAEYSEALQQREGSLVDHILAARPTAASTTSSELRATLTKIKSRNPFGIELYLAPNTAVERRALCSSEDRPEANRSVRTYAESRGLGSHAGKLGFGIAEEMLMNALYDAPVASGIPEYADLVNTEPSTLRDEHACTLAFASDGAVFAISVEDPFGALRRERLLTYLQKVLRRNEEGGIIDTKRGGAGLGLFKILYTSHALVCNVEEGIRTEVIALIHLGVPIRDFSRMPRSISYFLKRKDPA